MIKLVLNKEVFFSGRIIATDFAKNRWFLFIHDDTCSSCSMSQMPRNSLVVLLLVSFYALFSWGQIEIPDNQQDVIWLGEINRLIDQNNFSKAVEFCDSLSIIFQERGEWEQWARIQLKHPILLDFRVDHLT
ncbi:MAG: hypothetical protein AAFQ98_04400, partial [Bacteroidota bacterium]